MAVTSIGGHQSGQNLKKIPSFIVKNGQQKPPQNRGGFCCVLGCFFLIFFVFFSLFLLTSCRFVTSWNSKTAHQMRSQADFYTPLGLGGAALSAVQRQRCIKISEGPWGTGFLYTQRRKNITNISFWSGFPADIPDPYAQMPRGQKVSPHHRGRRKTHFLVRTSTIFGADVHDPKGCRKTLCKKVCVDFLAPIHSFR